MFSKEELIKSSSYWLEGIQNELYYEVKTYLKEHNMTQTEFAEKLGVSKGYVSQIMNGNFNFSLRKFIELSLAIDKIPILEFKPMADAAKLHDQDESMKLYSQQDSSNLALAQEPGPDEGK